MLFSLHYFTTNNLLFSHFNNLKYVFFDMNVIVQNTSMKNIILTNIFEFLDDNIIHSELQYYN